MQVARSLTVGLFTAAFATACAKESPTESAAPALSIGANEFDVVTLHLSAVAGSTSRLTGPIVVEFGTRYPPNPCLSDLELPDATTDGALVFCGMVRNPAGESFESGEFVIGGTRTDPVSVPFRLTSPTDAGACRVLFLRGALSVAIPELGPAEISATFVTADGMGLVAMPGRGSPDVLVRDAGSPDGFLPKPGQPEVFDPSAGSPERCTVAVSRAG